MSTAPLTRCARCNDFTAPAATAPGAAPCDACGAWRVPNLIRRHGPVTRTTSGTVSRGAEAAYDTMVVCLHRNDADGARAAAQRALTIEPGFIDAHLWLARLAPTPDEQRQHLHAVLAQDPFHGEATRLLMLLQGDLTPQQAARAADPYAAPVTMAAPATPAQERALLCPLCHAALSTHDDGGVLCPACGWHDPNPAHARPSDPATSLVAALIRQRAQPVRWQVAERVLRCQSCGAQSTLPADGHYSQRCQFCGTVQVVIADALDVLRQPDALARFRVRPAAAHAALEAHLSTHAARLASLLFNDNRVAQAEAAPVYVPFWAFDIVAQVTIRDVGEPRVTTAQARGLTVQASAMPAPTLVARLGAFDVRAAEPYTPQRLARVPALLYTRDFDRAALDARAKLARATQTRHGHGQPVRGRRNVTFPRSVTVMMQQITFTLVLLPLWTFTLYERDGQVRSALVHGQTGAVALGAPRDAA